MQESKSDKKFAPYVPIQTDMKELTFKAIFLGVLLSIILGAANAYLGLKAGMTVAATFPAAVISMAVLRVFRGTILEENLARTTGAVGEALAAGAIFTIPAFVIAGVWDNFDYVKSTLLMLVGGILGVLFVIILRRTLIDDQSLPYPESKACAEIVKAGQGGQSGAKYVFGSMGLAALLELFKNENGLRIIKDTVSGFFHLGLSKISLLDSRSNIIEAVNQTGEKVKALFSHKGGIFLQSPSASPAFLGVGYIIGFRLSAITFSGGVFGWLFLMPIVLFLMGEDLSLFADAHGWATMAKTAYSATVKPIAVGGMLVGAFYTLFKMRKNLAGGILRGLSDIQASRSAGGRQKVARIDKDAPFGLVLVAILVLVLCMVVLYQSFSHNWGSALLAAVVMAFAGFIFAAVAGYLVGIIGSSSNPISGLTLSTLLIAALLMVLVGMKGDPGVAAVLGVASVVCCVAGVAGDMMQDWKVGYMLGGTPWRMQIGGIIGVVAAALVLVLPIMLLHEANTIGSDALPAPQAGLMAMMSKGIVGGEMAWPLVIAGMLFAIALILIGSPSPMLISVGMYLPFNTTFAIFIGGLIKWLLDTLAAKKIKTEKEKETVENTGLLLASGLVAGEALTGIVLAALVVSKVNLKTLIGLPESFDGLWWLGLLTFVLLGYVLIKYPIQRMLADRKNQK
ncbi:MAG TPA: oligopeptide transporter, OPT family [bacterium]|nr:oligopeptide transporter, OPT family [bacterium]HNT64552.1 oligopeptide transporter, OPT family [bacterium]HOX84605.1 oligopeptide transporter, OPT family [bacterium]HPG45328.1 oligopeptide transporter, OPT family [bacterium]HPM98953.1 oligopeptide transporter, OPT family [bacterium]